MNITVRYFAGIGEAAGVDKETVELPPGSRVTTLMEELVRRHGQDFARQLKICTCIADGKRLDVSGHLSQTDHMAIDVLPPFSGG